LKCAASRSFDGGAAAWGPDRGGTTHEEPTMPARSARKTPATTPTVAEPTAPAFDPGDGAAPPEAAPAAAPPVAGKAPGQQQPGYKGLKVWQRAMDLATGIYILTRTLPDEDQGVIGVELRRTAVQIPSYIAAGNSFFHRGEYIQYLSAAHGAVARLESTLLVSERLGLFGGKALAGLMTNAGDVGRLLRGLTRALQPPPSDSDAPAAASAHRDEEPATAG
jgi:four helix bundle protein